MFFGTLLYNIADQMIGFFLPLFLFGIGSKLAVFSWLHVAPFVSGILFVVMYYALQRAVVLFTLFPLGKLMYRLGFVWSMVIGTLFLCGNFVGFYLARTDPRFITLSFVCGGIDMVLYWVAHDSLFAHEICIKEIGRGVGALAFLTKLIQIAVPAVSGLIIVFSGYDSLFRIGIVFLLLSCVPFFFIPKTRIQAPPKFHELMAWLREPRFRKFALVQVGTYMDVIALLIWPIYVLLIVGKLERVGYIFSFVLFLSLILTYITGWIMDHKKGRRMFVASGTIVSFTWIMRFFIRGVWDIIGIELVEKLAGSVYSPCYDSILCKRSKGKSVFAFHIYKEFLLSVDALVLWGGVFVLFLLPVAWTSIFLLGALGVGLSLFLDAKK